MHLAAGFQALMEFEFREGCLDCCQPEPLLAVLAPLAKPSPLPPPLAYGKRPGPHPGMASLIQQVMASARLLAIVDHPSSRHPHLIVLVVLVYQPKYDTEHSQHRPRP